MQCKLMLQSLSSSPAVYLYFSDRDGARDARNLSMALTVSMSLAERPVIFASVGLRPHLGPPEKHTEGAEGSVA